MANNSIDINDEFIERLGNLIENNKAPWQRPWEVGELYFPHNMASGKSYKGLNLIKLFDIAEQNNDPRFLTMKQANALGLDVKKGSHGIKISYIKTHEIMEEKNEKTGEIEKIGIPLEVPVIRSHVVFNGSQINGLKPYEYDDIKLHNFKPLDAAQQILDSVDVKIVHKQQNRAYYSSATDTITLPLKEQFKTPEAYYRTAFHEVAHAMGAKNRLNRDLTGRFGSNKYAKEELIAEISSFLIGGSCQLGFEPHSNSIAYLKSWSKGIKEDPNFLKDVIKQADEVKNMVLGNYFENLEKARENSYNQSVEENANKTIYLKIDKDLYKANKDLVKNEYGGKWDKVEQLWVFDSSKVSEEQLSKIGTIITKEETKSKENEVSLDNSDRENKISDTKEKLEKTSEKTDSVDKTNNKEETVKTEKTEPLKKQEEKIYIDVDYKHKDQAKELGAKWDRNAKSWYITPDKNIEDFKQFAKSGNEVQNNAKENLTKNIQDNKFYIAVPYSQKNEAKELGAKWDVVAKSWYCKESEKDKFSKWHVENQTFLQNKYENIEEKFLGKLQEVGVKETSLICDGNHHRIAVDGDKAQEKSGFYVAHLDGVPNIYFYNNRTGEEFKYVEKGIGLSQDDKDKHHAIVKANQIKREQEQIERREKAESKLKDLYASAESVEKNEYLERKNIDASSGLKVTNNNDLMIPIYDVDQNLKSAQYIKADGSKSFAKDCNYKGNFHVIDGEFDKVENCNTIIVTEGYATAKTIHEALRKNGNNDVPVIAAMSVNNLGPVMEAIEKKYPAPEHSPDFKKEFVIAADNDLSKKQNMGLETAKKLCENNDNIYITPKKEGREFDGDFNDLISKDKDSKDFSKNKALSEIADNIKEKVNSKGKQICIKLPVAKELSPIIVNSAMYKNM